MDTKHESLIGNKTPIYHEGPPVALLDSILAKFENGEERYAKSPLFHQCVDAIISGADPIVILGQVIDMVEQYQNELIQHHERYQKNI